MTTSYDAIVVGLGAMGSATIYQLAKRGWRVLGLDMFQPGHDQGSSHGYHRMIRRSAIQDDGYVPLADRAFERWAMLEEEAGRKLLSIVGEVRLIHPGGDPHFQSDAEEMQRRGFWEILSETDLAERFPGFRLHTGMLATYEANAGFLWSEAGIIAHIEVARQRGATIHASEEVLSWDIDGAGVKVNTTAGEYTADRLIVATGAWAADLLPGLSLPFQVIRSINGYFEPARPDWWKAESGAPDFLLYVPEGNFYGMPAVDGIGLKIGVSSKETTTARTIRRTVGADEIQALRDALDKYMPGASGPEMRHITCMDAYTRDGDFIIDRHPAHEQVIFGCGFSGRGYKFSPAVGEILADLATDGETRHDIAFLSSQRFA